MDVALYWLHNYLQWEWHLDLLEYVEVRLLTGEKDANLRRVVQRNITEILAIQNSGQHYDVKIPAR